MGYSGDLGDTFRPLDASTLRSSEYEMIFFQKECMEFLDEYMLVKSTGGNDQMSLVKKIGYNK